MLFRFRRSHQFLIPLLSLVNAADLSVAYPRFGITVSSVFGILGRVVVDSPSTNDQRNQIERFRSPRIRTDMRLMASVSTIEWRSLDLVTDFSCSEAYERPPAPPAPYWICLHYTMSFNLFSPFRRACRRHAARLYSTAAPTQSEYQARCRSVFHTDFLPQQHPPTRFRMRLHSRKHQHRTRYRKVKHLSRDT